MNSNRFPSELKKCAVCLKILCGSCGCECGAVPRYLPAVPVTGNNTCELWEPPEWLCGATFAGQLVHEPDAVLTIDQLCYGIFYVVLEDCSYLRVGDQIKMLARTT